MKHLIIAKKRIAHGIGGVITRAHLRARVIGVIRGAQLANFGAWWSRIAWRAVL